MRLIRLAALGLLSLPLLTGCASIEADTSGVDIAQAERQSIPAVAAKRPVNWKPSNRDGDQYVALLANKKASNSFAFGAFSNDLWAPFRVECTGGAMDARRVANSNGARVCVELDGRATNPLQFYGVCAQVVGGGLNVYAYAHTSQQVLGSQFFADVTEVDVAIEADLTIMRFQARIAGTQNWTEIAQVPFVNQVIPLLPAAGVAGMGPNAGLGFDNFDIVTNGDPPGALRPEQQVSRAIWKSIHSQLRAMHRVDGATPDHAAASTQLAAALTDLDAAIALAKSLDLGPKDRNVDQNLGKARKSLVKAQQLTTQNRKGKQIINQLKQALSREMTAAGLVYPATAPP